MFAPFQPPLLTLCEVEPKPPRAVVWEPPEAGETRPPPPENGTTTCPPPVRYVREELLELGSEDQPEERELVPEELLPEFPRFAATQSGLCAVLTPGGQGCAG
jgi:hypothetical protein